MAWDITIPSDGDLANTLHTIIQTAKKDIREIVWCWNGYFNEHNFYGSGADGTHAISQVGFIGMWPSKAAMGVPTVKGSLNFVMTSDPPNTGFYIVDSNGNLQYYTAALTDHTLLDNTQAIGVSPLYNDHTQYYCSAASGQVNGSGASFTNYQMAGNLYMASTNAIAFTGSYSPTLMTDAVGAAHASAGWGDAHTLDGGLIARHFSELLRGADICTTGPSALMTVPAFTNTYTCDWILNFLNEDSSVPPLHFFPEMVPNTINGTVLEIRSTPSGANWCVLPNASRQLQGPTDSTKVLTGY